MPDILARAYECHLMGWRPEPKGCEVMPALSINATTLLRISARFAGQRYAVVLGGEAQRGVSAGSRHGSPSDATERFNALDFLSQSDATMPIGTGANHQATSAPV